MNKMLVIYCHPDAPLSRANRSLRHGAQTILKQTSLHVTWHDLYENYPDFHIDVEKEQALLMAHDVLVFQHPLYWYSVPALLKQWFDDVLAEGWAYGATKALKNKLWGHWITSGGSVSAYKESERAQQADKDNTDVRHVHFSLAHLLAPLQQSARFCGCRWLEPQATYSSTLLSDEELADQAKAYAAWLSELAQLRFAPENQSGEQHA
jgi:glutathione-regulated potassium-efflux system ancillary protein KefG